MILDKKLSNNFIINDPWLGQLIGVSAYNIRLSGKMGVLARVLEKKLTNSSVFATLKLRADESNLSVEAQKLGFNFIDMSLNFEATTDCIDSDMCVVRHALKKDEESVCNIAETCFRYSRFHLDPNISNNIANNIKVEWARNYFHGKRGEAMLVAELNGVVCGFLQLCNMPQRVVVIDLIGVSPDFQGKGLAKSMISYISQNGIGFGKPSTIKVGTQACNIASISLYTSMGFKLVSAQQVLHFHSTH